MEDQIGALGLVLNAPVLFNTRYMDAAVNQLRADGFDVRDEDVARLSPFVRHHINMHGRYSFQLPDPPGGATPTSGPGQCRRGRRCALVQVVNGCPGSARCNDHGPDTDRN